ncbi:hypothetical protein ACIA78_34665 [Streptomyces xanthochromogenes]|uniref:hypothetical protein n=1 Tax=Streptomyces xanthochromogenes TaxID=67384 RepID=UPI0037A1111A
MHYAAGQSAADVDGEAQRQALVSAAPGYVAAAIERIAFDGALGLTPTQQVLLRDRAVELDARVVEDLTGVTVPI